ncbi:hypothetical protein BDV41DRAFT_578924 [Aspergillus transmontanensis]|uniref:Uncharacterized protein n=1 Tax=Aspergillus transmontanensis TaxID=1034304 RepID=A0A5N6VSA3_9EURO|nr:hypothetical protein BDV41DRAFT_578924 [Aspergillus transmontanensis]
MARSPSVLGIHSSARTEHDPRQMRFEFLSTDGSQSDEEMVAQAEESEEVWRDPALAELKIQAGLYLLDREAIESGLIKILWLDEHGNVAWHNRLDPSTSDLDGFTMALLSATSLVKLAGYDGTRGSLIER